MALGHGLVALFVEAAYAWGALPYLGALVAILRWPDHAPLLFPFAAVQAVALTLLVFQRRARS